VAYAPGELKAVCPGGASETLKTAGKPARVLLTVERAKLSANWDDVGYVRATIVDAQGTAVPEASTPLTFTVSGPGKILTTDSGDNADHSGFQKGERNAFHGSAIAVVRATATTGDVTVTVRATGLEAGSATLKIAP
jgi:beta-galactosidase